MKNIYLAKKGKVVGPITPAELENLRLTGEIENYSYQWDETSLHWVALELPPPPLGTNQEKKKSETPSWANFEAICHNFSQLISGKLESITDSGCVLVAKEHSDFPKLGVSSNLLLNVIDNKKDVAITVKASLAEVTREEGVWHYHLRWARRPAL